PPEPPRPRANPSPSPISSRASRHAVAHLFLTRQGGRGGCWVPPVIARGSHAGSPAWPGVRRLRPCDLLRMTLAHRSASIGPTVSRAYVPTRPQLALAIRSAPTPSPPVPTPSPHDLHMISIPSPHHPASVGYYAIS